MASEASGAPTLETIFQHNLWANGRLVDVCAGLDDGQLDNKILGVFGTIRETIHHVATAELSYLSRLETGQRYDGAWPETMAEIQQSLRETGQRLVAVAPKIGAADTVVVDWGGTGEMRDVPLTVILTQAINHATEHRSQILTMLTHLGVEPPELDGWMYFDEML